MKNDLNLDVMTQINKEASRIKSMEQLLGLGLNIPFNNTNSSPRKLMQGVEIQHALQIIHGKPAMLSTGYENVAAEYSSALLKAEDNLKVIGKISKFSFIPNHHYYIIVQNLRTKQFDVIERCEYEYITESYGILYDSSYLDKLRPGQIIPKGDTYKKSISFDEDNNRQDGLDLMCAFIATEHNKEDSIQISDVAAAKMASPLIKPISVTKNDNHIMLNIHGDENNYKVIPDIGEEVKGNILCALRTRKKEDSLFTESYYRLSQIMMSDERYLGSGTVVDINIYCNNPDAFQNYTDAQLKKYYDESMRFSHEVVGKLENIVENYDTTYALQKLYYKNKKIVNGGQYIKEKKFSNIVLEVTLKEIIPIKTGDKITNRYGGKGCTSEIIPQKLMPRLDNGEYLDIIYNPSGPYNREIMGAELEISINFIGKRILDYASIYPEEKILKAYFVFLKELCPNMYDELNNYLNSLSNDDDILEFGLEFLESLFSTGGIRTVLKPITESITIDDLNRIYKKLEDIGFPIKPYKVEVPQRDSSGNIRYIQTRRPLVAGYQYFYRLKQYAREKFSATSLSSINVKNENSKSATKKYYKALYSHTPIMFGPMESGDLAHVGIEVLIINLMLVSSSPHGRRLMSQLLTDNDPFNVDVRLDGVASNSKTEQLNAYLLTQGLELQFRKIPKKKVPMFKKYFPMFVYERSSDDFVVPMFTKIDPDDKYKLEEYYNYDYNKKNNKKKNIPLFKYDIDSESDLYKKLKGDKK